MFIFFVYGNLFFYYKNAAKNSTTSNCQKSFCQYTVQTLDETCLKRNILFLFFIIQVKKYILLKFQMKKEKIKWVIFLTNLFRFLFFLDSRLNTYLFIYCFSNDIAKMCRRKSLFIFLFVKNSFLFSLFFVHFLNKFSV